MDLNKIKKIYFVGIGGIGLSAVAKMMLLKRKKVFGSDLNLSEITDDLKRKGAKIFKGHKEENLPNDTDLLVYSPAVPEDNPERKKANKLNIPQFSYPEFLGLLSKNYFTIAISGTNGKSTTASMLGLILERANLDPTVIVGTKIKKWGGNLRVGKSRYFVVEACEWKGHMLNLFPKMIILTNIERDHLDYYKNLNRIITTFQKYVNKLPKTGILIFNADDKNLKKLKVKCKTITYGIDNKSDIMAKNIKKENQRLQFDLIKKGIFSEKIKLKIFGKFNIYNALAALSGALVLGVKPKIIKKALENFGGIWRRFEILNPDKDGYLSGFKPKITLISDYAHHPTAIFETIKTAIEVYSKRRIVVVFQPHLYSRTKNLFADFVKSFDLADLVIIAEIYSPPGREKNNWDISSKDLVREIRKRKKTVFYASDLEETKKKMLNCLQPNDVVLIMGAGDIYQVANDLASNKR